MSKTIRSLAIGRNDVAIVLIFFTAQALTKIWKVA